MWEILMKRYWETVQVSLLKTVYLWNFPLFSLSHAMTISKLMTTFVCS